MRIAQISPLWERVPPPGYGGIELVVSLLTDELVRRGHEVTLFATGDSETLAKLDPGCPKALRSLNVNEQEYNVYAQMQLSKVFGRANEFDIIHSHVDYSALAFSKLVKTPVIHTLHKTFLQMLETFLKLDNAERIEQIFVQHQNQNYVSVSKSLQRHDLGLNYVAAVYNAIAADRFEFRAIPEDPPYLAFLGRMSPEKGPHLAIEIARRSGWKLKMAGKIDSRDREFFEREVAAYFDGDQIQFLGEVDDDQKKQLIGGATATLFPITWSEPFGLVMPESMACGTPVIAMALGAAPEVIDHGKTGFLCDNVDECVAALAQVHSLDRYACRDHVNANFSVKHMTDGYEKIYQQVLGESFGRNGHLKKTPLAATR